MIERLNLAEKLCVGADNKCVLRDFTRSPFWHDSPLQPRSFCLIPLLPVFSITQTLGTVAGDVTGTGGWLYNATTGEVFVDDATMFNQ